MQTDARNKRVLAQVEIMQMFQSSPSSSRLTEMKAQHVQVVAPSQFALRNIAVAKKSHKGMEGKMPQKTCLNFKTREK